MFDLGCFGGFDLIRCFVFTIVGLRSGFWVLDWMLGVYGGLGLGVAEVGCFVFCCIGVFFRWLYFVFF